MTLNSTITLMCTKNSLNCGHGKDRLPNRSTIQSSVTAWKPDGTDLHVCLSTVSLTGVEELALIFRNRKVPSTNLGPKRGWHVFRVFHQSPKANTGAVSEISYTLNIEPIPAIIHRLIAKVFAHCPSHPNRIVQQIENYTLPDLTNM